MGKTASNVFRTCHCIEAITSKKAYDDAYTYWKVVFTICPASSERMYVDGANLVTGKIKAAKTKELKSAYVDTLLMIYDQRIKYFGNEGSVLGRKRDRYVTLQE